MGKFKKPAKKMLNGKMVYHTTGLPKHRYTLEEKLELSTKICALYATGKHTIEYCCKKFHVPHMGFLGWAAPTSDINQLLIDNKPLPDRCVPAIHEMYKEAKIKQLVGYSEVVKDAARHSLLKRIEGYETTEINEEYELDTDRVDENGEPNTNFGKMKLVKQRVKTKMEPPSDTAIIFALTNVDSDNFKNRNFNQVDATVKIPDASKEVAKLSDTELARKKSEIRSKLMQAEATDIEYDDVTARGTK